VEILLLLELFMGNGHKCELNGVDHYLWAYLVISLVIRSSQIPLVKASMSMLFNGAVASLARYSESRNVHARINFEALPAWESQAHQF
jgi:hypothetical protein